MRCLFVNSGDPNSPGLVLKFGCLLSDSIGHIVFVVFNGRGGGEKNKSKELICNSCGGNGIGTFALDMFVLYDVSMGIHV